MADLETKKTSELPVNSSPSASTTLVGVDNGETVQIPISKFVTKDENGDIVVHHVTTEDGIDCEGTIMVKEGYTVNFFSEDNSKRTSLRCDDSGKLTLDGKTVATVDDIPSGGSIGDTIRGIKDIEFEDQSGDIMANEDGLEVMSQFELQLRGGSIELDTPGSLWMRGDQTVLNGINSIGFLAGPNDESSLYANGNGIQITSPKTNINNVYGLSTKANGEGQPGQVLTQGNDGVYWANPSGGGSGSSNSIPFTYFTCYSNERTVRELLDQLSNEGFNTTDSITVIVTFSAMLSGTFLCNLNRYYGDYYGCEFTDLTNLKTYRFEGESRSLSLYDNLSGGSSEASMPRIRLSNWKYTEPVKFVMDDVHPDGEFIGEITFSICVQDGTVQEGDELQICALRKTYGKYKPRRFYDKTITAEDIENLAKQPYLQFTTTDIKPFYRTESGNNLLKKPKYIRIRRPIWGENKHGDWVEVNALFSNVVPVEIGLKYEDITQYE